MRITKQAVINKLFDLAQQNGVPVSRLLERITETFTVDTSHLPKEADGSFRYANGDYGIDVDLPDNITQALHEEAFREGVSTNEIINRAILAKLNELDIKA